MKKQAHSSVADYRARQRLAINELLAELTNIDCDPGAKEPHRRRLSHLLKDVNSAPPGGRLLASKIRDLRGDIARLKTRSPSRSAPEPAADHPKRKKLGKGLERYVGLIVLGEDPLAYQARMRGEWS